MYKNLLRPILFRFDAEKVHYFVVSLLKFFCKIPFSKTILQALYEVRNPKLQRNIMGLIFKNPVGLAAGFDKNAEVIDEMEALGFGFIEIGTLTPKAQDGNPKPRLFRLSADSALINRMGFNNKGVEVAALLLAKRKAKIIIGGNIGKNKVTPNENAVDDYCLCFEALYEVVDYFVVNVSSPNTPNLRDLQEKEPLTKLLQTLQAKNLQISKQLSKCKPILLKIAPDLTDSQLDDIIEIVQTTKIQGIIATNTTIDRSNLQTSSAELDSIGAGGLSGKPLKVRATNVIRYLRQKLGKETVIIGVGGIFSAEDAIEKLEAGADLIQLYTGFIYEGAELIKNINKKILNKL